MLCRDIASIILSLQKIIQLFHERAKKQQKQNIQPV